MLKFRPDSCVCRGEIAGPRPAKERRLSRGLSHRLFLILCLFPSVSRASAPKTPDYGILLLAHGGAPRWNDEIASLAQELDAKVPTEVALGMADASSIQKAVDRLESRRPAKIVAVPLFINSSSEVMDQTRYVLGLSDKPSDVFRNAMRRLGPMMAHHGHHAMSMDFDARARTRVPLTITPALDDHPLVARILLLRAKALSRDPSKETVILVGHGPVDDRANAAWLKTMATLARVVRGEARFKAVRAATIRDDSPSEVKEMAAAALRGTVRAAGENGGRAIVVPYLIAQGGIEDHIVKILGGLSYAWDGKALCPDPAIARWIVESADEAARGRDKKPDKLVD